MSEKQIPPYTPQFLETYPALEESQDQYEQSLVQSVEDHYLLHLPALKTDLSSLEEVTHGQSSYASLALRVPEKGDDASGSYEKVFGEVPEETLAILGGLYALTEASFWGESVAEQGKPTERRLITRVGNYQGQPVYFTEQRYFHTEQPLDGESEPVTQSVLVCSISDEPIG